MAKARKTTRGAPKKKPARKTTRGAPKKKPARKKAKKPAPARQTAAGKRASQPRRPARARTAPARTPDGRASTYNREHVDFILRQLMLGQTLRSICADPKLPAVSTFLVWVGEDRDDLIERYTRARDIGCDVMFDQIVDVAGDRSQDILIDDEGKREQNYIRLGRDKALIDALKWRLAKAMPKKYGNRVQVESEGGLGLGSVAIFYENRPVGAEDLARRPEDDEVPAQ